MNAVQQKTSITPHELHHLLREGCPIELLDVRTPAEYAAAHVSYARNEPLAQLRPYDQPVYLICHTGSRAAKAAAKFPKAIVVEGGTQAWIGAGLPVVCSPVRVISLERQVRIVAGSLVLVSAVLGWLIHPSYHGLSAFVGAGLVFAGITDFCGMGLLLAKMPWNRRTKS
jgi:rhodanese-related sulfurtransferase